MQDIATKVEGSQLTAEEFNQIPSEIENVITSTGQSLTNTDVRQLVKAISIYTGKGDFYNTSGTANNIILNPIDNMQTPIAYNDGLRVRFIASATNTNSVTINILGLTSCELLNAAGSSLAPGELVINKEYSATYLDGKFRLFASDTSKVNLNLGNSTAITNCITEIPQDIKLELADGVLTLKAGSKVYVPNGFEADGVTLKFDEVVVESDISVSPNDGEKLFFLTPNNKIFHGEPPAQMHSGGSAPTFTYGFWYDTTNNVVKFTSDGSTWTGGFSLPFAKGSNNSIDQVFNGFGYIGSTVFALPNVKGLIPNGRNEDGSLKNIEIVATSVTTTTVTEKSREVTVFLEQNGKISKWGSDSGNVRQYKSRPATPEKTYVKAYIEDENVWWYGNDTTTWIDKQYLVPLVKVYTDANALITSSAPKLPFRAADYQDIALKQNFQVVSTLPSSPQADVFYFIPE